MSSSKLISSTQPEILKQKEKDSEYIEYLFEKIYDVFVSFTPKIIPFHFISKNQEVLRFLASLFYYGLTTLKNNQTLGEEYSSILQINMKDWKYEGIPTIFKRKFFFYVLTCFPLFFLKKYVSGWMEKRKMDALHSNETNFRNLFWSLIPDFDIFVADIFKLHTALFFLNGVYLHLAKRISNIKYIFMRQPQEHNLNYKRLGVLMLIQIVFQFLRFLNKVIDQRRRTKNEKKNLEETETAEEKFGTDDENNICGLCFDKRKDSSVTPCGHLFCWDCIVKATLNKEECPQCRQFCPTRKIIQLRNFS